MEKQIKALIHLLSDPNEQVAKTIHDQLVQVGAPALPYLEKAEHHQPALGPRLADVKEAILFSRIEKEFQTLTFMGKGEIDLEAGTFLIARSAFPNLDVEYYTQAIDDMAEEVRPRLKSNRSTQETLQIMSQYMFKERGFRGNRTDYYDPENSFLNRVIDRRTGIPITLSALYLFLGHRLRLPLVGVGMPGHFVVKLEAPPPALFVDCFNEGIFLNEQACKNFLIESGIGYHAHYLEKSPNHLILARMLRNLIGIYQKQNERNRVDRLNSLIAILERTENHG